MSQFHPVLLVHGLNDTVAVFERMASFLTDLGWSVYRLNLTPNNCNQSLEILAHQILEYVETEFSPDQSIDLVGFSMGGIVTRYYLQRLGGIERVKRYVSISAPNQGTLTAYLSPITGIVQMRPHSPLLEDLNQDGNSILKRIKVTILWTPFDLMIIPPSSSQMAVGKEVKIPVLLHPWMLSDRWVLAAVAQALSEPILTKCDHEVPRSDRQ